MKKLYKHDCDSCTPLGIYRNFDLYHCLQLEGGKFPTVIARYGNDPAHYSSGTGFKGIDELQVAEYRSKMLGLPLN